MASESTTATIYYTTNGSDPIQSDPVVNQTVQIPQSLTLKAKAFDTLLAPSNVAEGVYELQMPPPQLTPGGSFAAPTTVSMSVSGVSGYQIRYTLDQLEPTETSDFYSNPINVATTTTVKAKAFKTGWTPSTTTPQTYTMNFGTLSPPTMHPIPPATAIGSLTVTLSSIPGATIRYTTNGTDPTSTSTPYDPPLVLETITNLKARAFHPDYVQSDVAPGTYTVKVPASLVTPSGGPYAAGQTVAISNPLAGAAIHYTIDGSTPTTTDPTIASGASITLLTSLTLNVKAFKTGCEPSDLVTHDYTVNDTVTPRVIAAGSRHALAIQANNTGWAWGLNGSGQHGDGTSETPRESPQAISALASIIDVDGGEFHTVSLKTDQTVLGSGLNTEGQVGKGSTSPKEETPVPVPGLTGIIAVAAGGFHTLALKSDGTVFSYGRNDEGQLGTDDAPADHPAPVPVVGLSGATITAIDAGLRHSILLDSNGRVWTFGANDVGQLGVGTTPAQSPIPLEVEFLPDETVTAIAAGEKHNLALTSDLDLYAWGQNSGGELGDGTTTMRSTPVAVKTKEGSQSTGMTKVFSIGAGYRHSFAVRADGSLWGFGSNLRYQLSSATETKWAQPIAGISGVVSATGGFEHSLAVTALGALWGWGRNQDGEVGIGSTETPQQTPASISASNLDWRVAKPVMSPVGGQYPTAPTVSITSE
ncbi:MAG: chitobiase/beta-hexosaminidase C-terminal domain-containing protein, partial [Vicinamibacteria bacterium]